MEEDRDRTSHCSDTESTGSVCGSVAIKLEAGNREIAKLLECPVCYDIVLPPITLCHEGHAICNPCKKNLRACPACRGMLTGIRNLFAENLLDQCQISCKFKDGGCKVVLPGRKLAEHQDSCNNRPILCRECDREIPYNKFLDHLRSVEKLETQRATECSTGFEIDEEEVARPDGERLSVWEPTWIHAHGHDFFCFLETAKQHWWIWVGGYCAPEVCQKFLCSITVWNKENETEMKYIGKIHNIRSTPEEVLKSGQCLVFLDVNLRNFIYKGGIDVLVRIDLNYEPPKTRKGTEVESPITLFGKNQLRANRVHRPLGVMNPPNDEEIPDLPPMSSDDDEFEDYYEASLFN